MQIHTVQPGDSIYSIAQEYGVPPSRIITDNMLDSVTGLVVGQDLVILFPTVTHTVRAGDSITSIAALYGTDAGTIYRNNPILGGVPDIYPGQILNIAYDTPPLGEISSNGYAYTTISRDILRRTLPYLTYLSVFSYGIRQDGSLIVPEGADELTALAREYDTVPLLVLTSLSESGTFSSELAGQVLADPVLRQSVVGNVVSEVVSSGYGGVDVDFEYIPAEYADEYAAFLTEIGDALGEEYPVFVSLAPKYSADQPGLLYEGHNYAALGNAADRVLLMTYEWGYTYGPPLPVSPIREVRRVIDYAVTEIPREKILIGVPNYGYDWTLPYVRGQSRARSLGNQAALELARQTGSEIRFDEGAQSPYFTYRAGEVPADHIVWFQNARSYDAMLRLVNEYGLWGAGVWNIMRFEPSLWLVMNALYRIRKGVD
ncbi:MAG: LysM peptidoglycan-binding domain-containing protein [Clostridia bacterium]|nr:LysM peptidoglycan-binding domain-containing protein [Clostridia bacterium]